MAKALEVEMSDFFGRSSMATKSPGFTASPQSLSGETGPSIVFNLEKSLRGSSRGRSTPTKTKASPAPTCTTLWSFRSATAALWRA
jgi:hypothetical protein